MADWLDIVAFVATFGLFAGAIYGAVYASRSLNSALSGTQKSLHNRGLSVSASGVSVKTSGRYSREEYIDRTRDAFVRGGERLAAAGTFAHADDIHTPTPPSRSNSLSATAAKAASPPQSPPAGLARTTSPPALHRSGSGAPSSFRAAVGSPGKPARKDSAGSESSSARGSSSFFRSPSRKSSTGDGGPPTSFREGSMPPEEKKKKGILGLVRRTSGSRH